MDMISSTRQYTRTKVLSKVLHKSDVEHP